jgi:hypothetical protein
MYGIQDKINQILRGAETIRKNQSMKPLQPVNSTTTFFAGKEPEEKTNEVARLRERLEKAEELIRGLHDGWKKARKAHLETCKNAQAEIDKLHTKNQKLTELCEMALYYHENDEIRSQIRKQFDQLNHNSNNKPS